MQYISTRGGNYGYTSAQAILQGIAPDGGLLVPERIPELTPDDILSLKDMDYCARAVRILSEFLDDYSREELEEYVGLAYGEEKFGEDPAPLVRLNKYNDYEYMLELWHGPTSAFKDMALQLLPHLLTAASRKTGDGRKVCILTATSGDTGKAALEGFRDVPGTAVAVFYPSEGVSETQRLQMVTQEGGNVTSIGVQGNFDDAQAGVKALFADQELGAQLDAAGVMLSSANSINWGRLAPQIVYYFSAYADMLKSGYIEPEEKINVVVPTGNFGNILSAWYAMQMGLPIHKLVCASNRNKVLSDFIRNGVYDRRREFYRTLSPSMDILVSSNLERLLFEMSGRDAGVVSGWMASLAASGSYSLEPGLLRRIQEHFVGGFSDDVGTLRTIREVYDRTDHLIDTHTAVGFNVYGRYQSRSGDQSKTLYVSTANPFKFTEAVSDALYGVGYRKGRSTRVLFEELSAECGLKVPEGLDGLENRPVLHGSMVAREGMKAAVLDFLGLENGA